MTSERHKHPRTYLSAFPNIPAAQQPPIFPGSGRLMNRTLSARARGKPYSGRNSRAMLMSSVVIQPFT